MSPPASPPRDRPTLPEASALEAEPPKADRAGYCLFLGEYIGEGSTVCWQSRKYVCVSGDWQDTGEAC